MLTEEQLKLRENRLTASRVGVLMTGDAEKIIALWKEMLGVEQPPDLSDVWPVRLGEATEMLNLEWYEKKHGELMHMGEVIIGEPDWMAATLDAWDEKRQCPVEAKHCGGFEPLDVIIGRYNSQCHWQMMVTGAKECALSVIMGAKEPIIEYVPFNEDYAKELMRRAKAFMKCVEELTPPVVLPKEEPPPIPRIEYDMTKDKEWGLLAERWLQAFGAAQIAKEAEAKIKAMVPLDALRAFGAGIVVTRNRAGALALRQEKQ